MTTFDADDAMSDADIVAIYDLSEAIIAACDGKDTRAIATAMALAASTFFSTAGLVPGKTDADRLKAVDMFADQIKAMISASAPQLVDIINNRSRA